jgi:hypothetical protein
MPFRADFEKRLIDRANADAGFKQLLLNDPRAAVERELGMKVPSGANVKVLQETPDTMYLVLPLNGSNAELTDEDLESVAGGTEFSV